MLDQGFELKEIKGVSSTELMVQKNRVLWRRLLQRLHDHYEELMNSYWCNLEISPGSLPPVPWIAEFNARVG